MRVILSLSLFCALATPLLASESVDEAIVTIRTASPTAAATSEVQASWKILAAAEANEMTTILRGMDDSNPAVENWIRTAVDAIGTRTLEQGGELPKSQLEELLADTSAAPRARRTAYEWLEKIDADGAHELLAGMTNDPSLELRYDAVAAGMQQASTATGDEAIAQYRKLLDAARDLDQIKKCKAALEEKGEKIDLAKHMGFVTSWRVIGFFDNSGKDKFAVAYPPEETIDFEASYDGKTEAATWRAEPITTDDDLGNIDLNDAMGPEKGAAVYMYAEVDVPAAQAVQVRYASPNGVRVWVNGKLVASNEVYHAGGEVDQYTADTNLVAGKNTLLIKVCQNEQKESWAQNWSVQLRLCDALGGGIPFTTSGERAP
ncbi:hypothetical protein [Aeoliella sp. SH292]|uniref:hypothetical protein n=1 Tax=Aeoliella sp. SH292 TaxID=3454464 RepID=UPI003F9E8976